MTEAQPSLLSGLREAISSIVEAQLFTTRRPTLDSSAGTDITSRPRGLSITTEPTSLQSDDWRAVRLCCVLEDCLRYGERRAGESAWDYIAYISTNSEFMHAATPAGGDNPVLVAYAFARDCSAVRTPLGRLRVWLRHSLLTHTLHTIFRIIYSNNNATPTSFGALSSSKRAYYQEWALVLDVDSAARLFDLVESTKGISFQTLLTFTAANLSILDSKADTTLQNTAAMQELVQLHKDDAAVTAMAAHSEMRLVGGGATTPNFSTRSTAFEHDTALTTSTMQSASRDNVARSRSRSSSGGGAERSLSVLSSALSFLDKWLPFTAQNTGNTPQNSVKTSNNSKSPTIVYHFHVPLVPAAFDPRLCVHALLDPRLSSPDVLSSLLSWLLRFVASRQRAHQQHRQMQQQAYSGEARGEGEEDSRLGGVVPASGVPSTPSHHTASNLTTPTTASTTTTRRDRAASSVVTGVPPGLGLVSPSLARVVDIAACVDGGGSLHPAVREPEGASDEEGYAVAQLLIFFCAALPDPLVSADFWEPFLDAVPAAGGSQEVAVTQMKAVVNALPLAHSFTLLNVVLACRTIAHAVVEEHPACEPDIFYSAIAPAIARPSHIQCVNPTPPLCPPSSGSSAARTGNTGHVLASTVSDLCSGVLLRLSGKEREQLQQAVCFLFHHIEQCFENVIAFRTKLQRQLDWCLQSVLDMHGALCTSVTVEDPRHLLQLKRLWEASAPCLATCSTVDCTTFVTESSFWKALGFSSARVADDLVAATPLTAGAKGSAGLLALMVLVYLSERHSSKWESMLHSLHRRTSAEDSEADELGDQDYDVVSSSDAAVVGGGWYPLASAAALCVRRLAEACYLYSFPALEGSRSARQRAESSNAPQISPPSPSAPQDGVSAKDDASGSASFSAEPAAPPISPLMVVNGLPDFWLLIRAASQSQMEEPGSPLSLNVHIPSTFMELACLAVFIMHAKWQSEGNFLRDLPRLIVEAVSETIKMLPLITQDVWTKCPFLTSDDPQRAEAAQSDAAPLFNAVTMLGVWRSDASGGRSVEVGRRSSATRAPRHTASTPLIPTPQDETPPHRVRSATQPDGLRGGAAARELPRLTAAASETPFTPGGTLLSTDPRVLRTLPLSMLPTATLSDRSSVLDARRAALLEAVIPKNNRGYEWHKVYSLVDNGASLSTLIMRSREHCPTLLLIKDDSHTVFGGFSTEPWAPPARGSGFFGNGQSFVFTFANRTKFDAWRAQDLMRDMKEEASAVAFAHNAEGSAEEPATPPVPPPSELAGTPLPDETDPYFSVYKWSRRNKYFQICSSDGIGMGGGGSFAWFLDADLCNGHSGMCDTFVSPCLAGSNSFTAIQLEVWAFRRRIHFTTHGAS